MSIHFKLNGKIDHVAKVICLIFSRLFLCRNTTRITNENIFTSSYFSNIVCTFGSVTQSGCLHQIRSLNVSASIFIFIFQNLNNFFVSSKQEIETRAFEGLNCLVNLTLRNNKLKQLEPTLFNTAPAIHSLDLSVNLLTRITFQTILPLWTNFLKKDSSLLIDGE